MFYFVFICFVNRAVVKDKIWWYHRMSHWILCRKLCKNIFLAEKTNQVISIFLTDINTKTPKKRPHTQLFDVDVSREKGHNLVIFSVRKKFLNFIMLRIQREIQWYHQILCFIALLLSILKKDFEQKRVTLRLWTLEKKIQSKSLISQSF